MITRCVCACVPVCMFILRAGETCSNALIKYEELKYVLWKLQSRVKASIDTLKVLSHP